MGLCWPSPDWEWAAVGPRRPERRDQDLVRGGAGGKSHDQCPCHQPRGCLRSSCARSPKAWEKWTAPHRCSGETEEIVHVRLWWGLSRGRGEGRGQAVSAGSPAKAGNLVTGLHRNVWLAGSPTDPCSPSPHDLPEGLGLAHSPVSRRRAQAPFQKEKMETPAGTEIPLGSLEGETEESPRRRAWSRPEIRKEQRARASQGTSWDRGPREGLMDRRGIPGIGGPSSAGPGEPTARLTLQPPLLSARPPLLPRPPHSLSARPGVGRAPGPGHTSLPPDIAQGTHAW